MEHKQVEQPTELTNEFTFLEENLEELEGFDQDSTDTNIDISINAAKPKEKMDAKDFADYKALIKGIFEAQYDSLKILLESLSEQTKLRFLRKRDNDWNTPIMLNVKLAYRNPPLHIKISELLMEHGADPRTIDKDHWSCMRECIDKSDKQHGVALFNGINRIIMKNRARMEKFKNRIDEMMLKIPDFSIELSYNVDSSFIPLIGRLAPSDTLKITKYKDHIRCENTFAGYQGFSILRKNIRTIYNPFGVPKELEHLHRFQKQVSVIFPDSHIFSLPSHPLNDLEKEQFLDHRIKQTQKEKAKGEETWRSMQIQQIQFDEAKSFWGNKKEDTQLFGHSARQFDLTVNYEFISLVRKSNKFDLTFEDYWKECEEHLSYEQKAILENIDYDKYDNKKDLLNKVIQDMNQQISNDYQSKQFAIKSKTAQKSVLGLWISQQYPIKFADFKMILDVIKQQLEDDSEENVLRHLEIFLQDENLNRFLDLENGFPVKMQIPLRFSLYAAISFQNVKLIEKMTPEEEREFFTIPSDCKYVGRDVVLKQFSFSRPDRADEEAEKQHQQQQQISTEEEDK